MARSKRDDMKRKIAQAINHQAAAILDCNDVYKEFKATLEAIAENPFVNTDDTAPMPTSPHAELAKLLEITMINQAKIREGLIVFADKAWMLTEEELIKWM